MTRVLTHFGLPLGIYLTAVLNITTFLFQPGHLFLLDMVMGPKIDLNDYMVDGIDPHFPITVLLFLLNQVIPAYLVQKLLLAGVLLFIGCSMYYFARQYLNRGWAIVAGLFYLINPYVFERFGAGQWLVLLGYGFFPIALSKFNDIIEQPTRTNIFIFTALYAIYPILSIHWWFMSSGVLVAYSVIIAVNHWEGVKTNVISVLKVLFGLAISTLAVNWFWLQAMFTSSSTFAGITSSDLSAFFTVTDPQYGIWFNVLSLYGFWSTEFILPKDLSGLWWLATLLTLVISIIGLKSLWQKNRYLSLLIPIIFIVAVIIAVGFSSTITKDLTIWLTDNFPGFKGLRDTAKVVGLLSFSYALLAPLGAKSLSQWLAGAFELSDTFTSIACALGCLSIPLTTYPAMVNSYHNQLPSADYPYSWYRADELLTEEKASKILILPWHGYVGFSWSNNHPIINPGRVFFTPPVEVSTFLDNPSLDSQLSDYDRMVFRWLNDESIALSDINQLKERGISHLVLFKTADYEHYHFLESSTELNNVYDSAEITVYRLP